MAGDDRLFVAFRDLVEASQRLSVRKNYVRDIKAMEDSDLEQFVSEWMQRKTEKYVSTERFSGPGDMGRDVVGYRTALRHEGKWDNFQCKQLTESLSEPNALRELAKIFCYSSEGNFSLPERYTFIAPHGVARTVKALVAHPTKFKARLLETWDKTCAGSIRESPTPLTEEISKLISSYDFSKVDALDAPACVRDEHIRPCLVEWFGEDPGEAPDGQTPLDIQLEEAGFVSALVDAYSERAGSRIQDGATALLHPQFGEHLNRQRVRYFHAAAFKRYYRDNTPASYVVKLEDDIHHGIAETHAAEHRDALERVDKVMEQASVVQPSGVLAKYARVPVKQGICHHFVNEGRIKWKR